MSKKFSKKDVNTVKSIVGQEVKKELTKKHLGRIDGSAKKKSTLQQSRATRSAVAAQERPSSAALAGAFARNLLNPEEAIARPPSRIGHDQTSLQRQTSRFLIATDANGRFAVATRPGVWGVCAASSVATNGGDLDADAGFVYIDTPGPLPTKGKAQSRRRTVGVDALGRPRMVGSELGWEFTGVWSQNPAALSMYEYGAQFRPVGHSVKIEVIDAAVDVKGTVTAAQIPHTVPLPFTTSEATFYTRWTNSDLAQFVGARTLPAIEGLHASLMPYSEQAFDYHTMKPSGIIAQLASSRSFNSWTPPSPLGGGYNGAHWGDDPGAYPGGEIGFGPVDGPEDIAMSYLTAMASVPAAVASNVVVADSTVGDTYNLINSYFLSDGWGCFVIMGEGLQPSTAYGWCTVTTNFEFLPDVNTLQWNPRSDLEFGLTDTAAMDMVMNLMPVVKRAGGNLSGTNPSSITSTLGDILKGTWSDISKLSGPKGALEFTADKIQPLVDQLSDYAGVDAPQVADYIPSLIQAITAFME